MDAGKNVVGRNDFDHETGDNRENALGLIDPRNRLGAQKGEVGREGC